MPTYEVTSPDGRTFEVTAPDGATKDDVLAYAQQQFASLAEPAPPQKPKFKDYLKDIPKAVGRGGAGLLETSAIGASALLPDEYEEAARKGIAGIAKPVQEYLAPSSQEVGESTASKVASGLGSILPMAPLALLGVPGALAGVGVGFASGAGEARLDAEKAGATAEQKSKATGLGVIPGGFDAAVDMALAAFPGGAGKAIGVIRRALISGGIEGATEAAQQVAQNAIAKNVYKPEQELLAGASEQGEIGAAVGALASFILDAAIPGRRRGAAKDTGAPQPERELTQAPERAPVETFTRPPVGFDAERAAGLRAQAEQAEQDRLAGIEAGRLAEEAAAQEAVRGMPSFAGTPDINTELLGIARADRAEEQKRLEAERRAQIKQIENTQFSTDPFQDQIMRNRALQQIAPAPAVETTAAPEPRALSPEEQEAQNIKDFLEQQQRIQKAQAQEKIGKQRKGTVGPFTPEEKEAMGIPVEERKAPAYKAVEHPENKGFVLDEQGNPQLADLAQGAQKFKSKAQADEMKGNLADYKVIAMPGGGFAISPKTEAELKREGASKLGLASVGKKGMPLSAHEMIASEGGLNADAAKNANLTQMRVGNRYMVAGKGKGLTANEAREKLESYGYVQPGEIDDNQALQMVANSVKNPRYTPDGYEQISSIEREQQAAEAERADLAGQLETPVAEEMGYLPYQATPEEMNDALSRLTDAGLDADAITEQAFEDTKNGTDEDFIRRVVDLSNEALGVGGRRGEVGAAPIMEELRQQRQGVGNSPTPEGTKIEKELTGKSFDQLVQWSVDNAPNRFNKLVAQKVQAMIRALKQQGVEMQFDLQGGKSRNIKMREAEGITTYLFSSEGTNVFLQLNGEPVFEKQFGYPSGMSYGTIQHELLHVATRSATRFLPADHPAIKDLNELYGQVVKQYNKDLKAGTLPPVLQKYYKRINNVLETPDELITWGLTDREFQEYLANIKVGPKQTAFSKLVSLVREMLGIAKPFETAMEKLVRTTDSILETDIEVIKGSMQKLGYVMGKAKPPTTQLKQQSLFSKRVQQLLQDDLMVRKNGFYFDAKESPLYQTRTAEQARVVSNQDFESAVRGTKTGQRIMDKNIQIKDGDYVGVRLDLNILRSTGVPVQSIHQGKESTHEKGSGFFNGEVIKYAPWVTLKNVRFKIQQGARERIASGQETKSPMGSADGQYVATDKPNFDGIELRFNPNREHLFRDALGRAVKYADEITTTRNGVFARGNIEYFGEADVPPVAKSPSESRLMREGEMQAKEAAQKTGSVPAPIQESLFAKNGLGQQDLFADEEDVALENFLKPSKEKRVLYHGTSQGEIKSLMEQPEKRVPNGYMWGQKGDETYKGAIYLTPDPYFANHFAQSGTKLREEDAGKYAVYPVYVRAEKPFDYANPKHIEMLEKFFQKQYDDWHKKNPSAQRSPSVNLKHLLNPKKPNFSEIESPEMQYAIQKLGFDSFYVFEGGVKNLGVYDPKRIKSSLGKPSAYRIEENLLKQAAPQRTQLGNDTMEMLEGIGRTVAAPEPGYADKVRQSWDNYRDNPQATREAAYGSFRRFADQVETWAFSSDAGLNNQIRREIMNSMVGQEQKIGMLLNTSLSQTAHSDAVSNLFLMEGNIKYDAELHKWVGVKDDNNIINLSKKLDEVAEKLGLTKPEVELMAHTAFEARRTQELNRFNEQIERQAAAMKEQARIVRAAGRSVAASALNEKANNLLKKKKITTNMTPEALQTGLRLYDMHPGLKEVTKIWNGIRKNALDRMVDSGLYTKEEAEMLMSAADYVPFFREDQIEEGKGPKEFLRSLAVQADKRLKGSNKPVNDIFDNMVRWTQYAINRGVRNRSGVALAQTAEQMGLAIKINNPSNPNNIGVGGVTLGDGGAAFATAQQASQYREQNNLQSYNVLEVKDDDGKSSYFLTPYVEEKNVAKVWENGKQVEYSMADPMFISAFRGLESVSIPTVKFFSKFADVLRQSVVLYPLFSIAQVPQDSFAAMFTSGLKPQHALTIPVRAVKEFIQTLRGKSKAHEELKNVGAVGVRDFTSAIIRADAEIAAGLKEEKGLWAGVKRRLGNWAMAADNAVRQATYEAALAQGLSRAEAIEKAFEIFNVRRRGNSQMLALAGQVIPFFNAYLAAQHVAYRTLTGVGTSPTERKAAFQTLAATTGSVMALSLLYAMMNGDDEDYLNKPTPTRDRLLMIPGTGGLGLPLRADIFALPKVLAEHTYLLMTDNGYEDPAKFRASMASLLANSIFSPTPVPQAIKPLAEAIMNYDFFQQKPLVGTFQQRKELSRQFEDSTSEFAKVLGSTNMVSPIVADHMIRGMFGSFGGLFLYMTNPILAEMAGTPRPALSMQDALATIPNASAFVSKEYEVALRKDFYALKEATDRVGATVSDLKTRSPQELADYLSDEDVRARYALTPAVNQIAQQLTTIRKAVTAISQAPEERMDEDEKQRQIKQLREAELRLLKGVNLKALRERANI